ncbi:MAG TPA: hypothetical protein VEY09_17290 [Pyrinomonadaceae bacterium]|nr:hypothetical protein [Pyrinomonadaceae bacterium]
MRTEFDREFDALLRRTAGGAGRAATPGGDARPAPASSHLDADERAAFAEGALPAAARAAYVSHLADCDECRTSVTALASAAGVALRLAPRDEAAEAGSKAEATADKSRAPLAGRRSWLASLFAPRVLRFAAPALALCLVGVVSFVALRSDRGGEGFDVRPEAREPNGAPVSGGGNSPGSAGASADAAVPGNYNSSGYAEAPAPADANASAVGTTGRTNERQASPGGTSAGPSAPPPAVSAEAERAARATAEAPHDAGHAAGGGTAASAAAAPAPESREAAKRQEAERGRDSRENVETAGATGDSVNRGANYGLQQQSPDGSRGRSRADTETGAVRNSPSPPPPPRDESRTRNELPPAGRAPARKAPAAAAAGEGTRAVEGRRFRRAGGVWVDAEYKDSLPSTGVRRGTEAFRALVAELPEVGRVAEQLSGEVVVVVRGRAYRIRP